MNLKNNFILAPLKLGYSDGSGTVNEKYKKFYGARSENIGAVILEPLYIDKGLREIPTQLGIDNDDKIPGLRELVNIIHNNGAKVIAHLNHPGRMANPKIPGNFFLSSTDKPCENGGAVPKSMDKNDMDNSIDLFVKSAIRAEKAGFDIVELQFGHGYLLAQFLSPAVNDRKDEFNGDFEKRASFPLRVFDAVKKSVSIPIIVRVSGEEMTPTGIKIDETINLVKKLKEKGVTAVHVSAGTVCSTPPWFFQHMFIPKGKTWEFAGKIKKETNIPVIFVGRINSISDIKKLNSEFHADYIALGRALVADPDFIGKYNGKIDGNIRPCLACSEGCLGGVKSGKGLGCVVNPLLSDNIPAFSFAKERKTFAVIGAGLTGLETAITLKARGYNVDLYEKDVIGGQFNLAWLPPHKDSLKDIIDYYSKELKRNDISIINREAVDVELLNGNYDGVIIATGAVPVIPPIKGLKNYFWAEFLLDQNLPDNKKIVVIGGGLIGIEIASKLVEKNNDVIIIEMLSDVARGMEMIEKAMTLKKLKEKNIPIYTNTKVESISEDKVFTSGEHQLTIENVDHIVVATGMESYLPLYGELKGKIPVYIAGDAKKIGKAQDAIKDGYTLALTL